MIPSPKCTRCRADCERTTSGGWAAYKRGTAAAHLPPLQCAEGGSHVVEIFTSEDPT